MGKPLIETVQKIQEIIEKGHPAREVFSNKVSFLARGDEVGKTTRQVGVYSLKNERVGFYLKEVGYKSGGIHAPWLEPVILPGNAGEVRATDNLVAGLPRGTWNRIYDEVHKSLVEPIMDENKRRYSRWRETGQEPDYVPDLSGQTVSKLVEEAWQPFNDGQIGVLEKGLIALLQSLQDQPKNSVIKLIF